MKNWRDDDVRRLEEEAAKLLPADAVAAFVEDVRLEALSDRYLPLDRQNKADAARHKKDLEAIRRVLDMVGDDEAVVRRLKVEHEFAERAWQRCARQDREGILGTRRTARRGALVDQFCRSIAGAVGCHLGALEPGASPSTGDPASGITPLISAALRACGYDLGEVTFYKDILDVTGPNKAEAQSQIYDVRHPPFFLAD